MSAEHIKISLRDGVRKILLNRPEKKNALTQQMYKKLTQILNEDAENDQVVVTILTGTGEFYSSGNDMKSSLESGGDLQVPRKLVQAFIDYPKIIIAVLNGPAIGIAATTLALCDIVYASNRAYIDTPFIRLSLCAEGASSYLFPRILGRSKASELLLLGNKLSAREAWQFGLVSDVIPHEQVGGFIEGLYKYGSLPVEGVKVNKGLVMRHARDMLTKVNDLEVEALQKCVGSDEFQQMVVKLMQRRSKL